MYVRLPTPFSLLYSTLCPLRAMSRRLRWHLTEKLEAIVLKSVFPENRFSETVFKRIEGCFLNEVLPENRAAVLIRTGICHFKKHH